MPQQKKIPLRKCTGCNEMKPKRELIRIVRTPEGEILTDATGKCNGRGAYICPDAGCLQKARKGRRLEKAFECSIPEEIYDRLETEIGK